MQKYEGRIGVKVYEDGTEVPFIEDEKRVTEFEMSLKGKAIRCSEGRCSCF